MKHGAVLLDIGTLVLPQRRFSAGALLPCGTRICLVSEFSKNSYMHLTKG